MTTPTPLKKLTPTVEDELDTMDALKTGNLRIWNALGKTDPAHTKQFSRAGGFKGTAIKPIWITQRLTELFGPCGTGWGMDRPEFKVVEAGAEVLVYCTVAGWYRDDIAPLPKQNDIFPEDTGKRAVYGVGGDKVLTVRNDGKLFHDDEAFKKAFTDALGNAFKFIGVGADVHMGLFEDSKYLAEVRADFAANDTPKTGETGPRKSHLDGPYDTLPKLEKAAREFARTLRGMGSLEDFETWKQDEDVIAFVDQCKRDLPGWWFANHPECPADFTPLSVEVANTKRGLEQIDELRVPV